ncbi:phage holin family protein [Agromyces protaetiae]|nr:phage holin family protein [Agromyces protaetiae]
MVRILIRLAIFLGTAALALFIATLLIPGFRAQFGGFILAVIVFAVVQTFLAWLVEQLFAKAAPTVAGVAGLISTALALWIATWFPGGLRFDGLGAWVLAAVVVWILTAIITWAVAKFLPSKTTTQR